MELKTGDRRIGAHECSEEWRDCDISDLCQLQRGFDLTEATRKHGEIPVYSSSGLSYFHNEARLKAPAVITGRKGMLGKVFFVEEPCWPHDTTLWVKDFKGNDPRFVALFLGQFRLERFDAATSVPTLNRNNLVGFPIALPSLPEQRAIAEAVSNVDELLGGLDGLIAKKRNLKQAAMQQLLTGQTRLPGFYGEWEVKRLGTVADVLKGNALSKSMLSASGTRPCILYGELFTTYGRVIFEVVGRTNSSEGCPSISGDVLMPGSTTTTGADLATASALLVDDVALGGDIIVIRRKDQNYDSSFLAYYLTQTSRHDIAELTQGITIHHLYGKDVKTLSLRLPSLVEQTAIAEVLTEMDAELAALEQRREKTRALKQAMMQELLTGRTRLVSPEVAHA